MTSGFTSILSSGPLLLYRPSGLRLLCMLHPYPRGSHPQNPRSRPEQSDRRAKQISLQTSLINQEHRPIRLHLLARLSFPRWQNKHRTISKDAKNQLEQISHPAASIPRPFPASMPNRIFGTARVSGLYNLYQKDAVRKSSVIRRTAKASRSEIKSFDRSRGRRNHLHKYIRFCHRQRTALSATDKRRAICCGIELCTHGMSG